MKLREIINKIDVSSLRNDIVNLEDIFSAVGLEHSYVYLEYPNEAFKIYTFGGWLCTDVVVGYDAIWFNDEFVMVRVKAARKIDPEYHWVSEAAYKKVKEYCISLMPPEDTFFLDFCSLDEEMGAGFSVTFSGQLLRHQKTLLSTDGEQLTVVETFNDHNNPSSMWHKVRVKDSSGEELLINMRDVLVPWETD